MAEVTEARAREGSPSDRKPNFSARSGAYLGTGLFIAMAHFLIKCFSGGHFHWVVPDDALLEVLAPAVLAPLDLINTIVMARLRRAAAQAEGS